MATHSQKSHVTPFERPHAGRATWQLINSVALYLGLWVAMVWLQPISWWLALPVAMLSGAVLVRVFIIFHDCGHGSFFASRRANSFWGYLTGVLTFTPYEQWRGQHAIHHGSTGNLDRRGVGDIWTMTVREWQAAGRWKRLLYRLSRDPIFLLFVAPLLLFLVDHRIPSPSVPKRARRSVWWTTLGILVWGTGLTFVFGFVPFLILQLTVLSVAGAIGVWLFYTQHQFEGAYWRRADDWSYEDAALEGSAFLKLPKVLQWFTGNIGYHHIHHLSSRIPNYNLQACHDAHPDLSSVTPLTIMESIRTFSLKLWDEAEERLVCFRHAAKQQPDPV